jgi:hypothetical protein
MCKYIRTTKIASMRVGLKFCGIFGLYQIVIIENRIPVISIITLLSFSIISGDITKTPTFI